MGLPRLSPPTTSKRVTSGWGADRSHRGGTHKGLDFNDPVGSPVRAAADGVVIRAKNVDDSLAGKFVAIQHSGGVISRYLHNLENLVTSGQRVTRGQKIALLGQTGTSGLGNPHVHFDIKLSQTALEEYRCRFGTPTPGYGPPTNGGISAPAEALMSGATYSDSVKEASLRRGVVFYRSKSLGMAAIIGGGVLIGILAEKLT